MSILEVPGARLYYEIHGRGLLMIMIPGASGTATPDQRQASLRQAAAADSCTLGRTTGAAPPRMPTRL